MEIFTPTGRELFSRDNCRIWIATSSRTSLQVVIKRVRHGPNAEREIRALQRISASACPNIIGYYTSFSDARFAHIVTEVGDTDLFDYVTNNEKDVEVRE